MIGGTLAHLISIKELADVVLFDVAEGLAKGKALDIAQSTSISGSNINLTGTSNYKDTKNSDVIIITAGIPRKPGMSRDDLNIVLKADIYDFDTPLKREGTYLLNFKVEGKINKNSVSVNTIDQSILINYTNDVIKLYIKDTDILIVNHQSMMDIFSLEEVVGLDVRFIGRTGIMDVWPVSRIVDIVGHITVDQKDRRAIIKLLKDVKVCKGKKVVIFPEGTRSRSGKIEPFEAGAKLLVEKLKLKAQPVVIKNVLDIYDESNKTATSGTIEIEALPAVTATEGWYEEIHQQMSKTFNQR